MKLVELTGEAVDWLEAVAWAIVKASEADELHTVAVAIDSDGLKFKINYGTWTPGHGVVTGADQDQTITEEQERDWNDWKSR